MFHTVLIANRGEIAVRIIRTLRRLGVRSVAVFSDADTDALHVRIADAAIRLGPARPRQSYLDVGRILHAAAAAGADAVHPGYGFLAEDAAFARACGQAGVVFIGPTPEAIELMGDKIRARATVAAAGVPVIPGCSRPGMTDDDLVKAAQEIGFPVLVKPGAGGGGKGMHVVERAEDLTSALASARRESSEAFGDDALYLERCISRPRHIEVQVLGDRFGTVVPGGDRECSLQRRHQKVMEEAPAPFLDDARRARLFEAAVAAARTVRYTGAGTVEFLVSSEQPHDWYFMEMNTRLQVEHPVTELISGLDLVELQLRIAAGEPLNPALGSIQPSGHAIEARVYAEDPSRGFVPSAGRIALLRQPSGEGVRVDSGVVEGVDVATQYDPLLSKVVAWGPDRDRALARLRQALSGTVLLGVVTNVAFLRALTDHPDVVAGHLDTGLLERDGHALATGGVPTAAFAAYSLGRLLDQWPDGPVVDPWDVPTGWRPGRRRPLTFRVRPQGLADPSSAASAPDEGTLTLSVLGTPDDALLWIGDADPIGVGLRHSDDGLRVSVDGSVHHAWRAVEGGRHWISVDGVTVAFDDAPPPHRLRGSGTVGSELRSPMPGTVIEVRVASGQTVQAGQPMVVVEAMKMEHVLTAPRAGVAVLEVGTGDAVVVDQVVARVERGE